ncbi:MAG: hypothetical protein SWY16_14845 [Cyanobacteriota bacterium]|nr:hypothetical protein [Cyanobacteriota bacterium]
MAIFASPALAHNVKTDADVGATFHIEPDHNPQAGDTARAWFALTRTGGELIPLDSCDCQLAVYDRTVSETEPVLTPPLVAISAEEFRDIPGADIVFPEAGVYDLEISGSPKDGAAFSPFSLSYSVTVSPGASSAAPESETESEVTSTATEATSTSESPPPTPGSQGWLVPAIITTVAIAVGVGWFVKQQAKSEEGS